MEKIAYSPSNAPQPFGNVSQAVRRGSFLAISGQLGLDSTTGTFAAETVEQQARQAFENVRTLLNAAGASYDDVIMLRVYLLHNEDFPVMNKVYNEFVSEPFPARTTVEAGLAAGALVEVDALAVVGD